MVLGLRFVGGLGLVFLSERYGMLRVSKRGAMDSFGVFSVLQEMFGGCARVSKT